MASYVRWFSWKKFFQDTSTILFITGITLWTAITFYFSGIGALVVLLAIPTYVLPCFLAGEWKE